jgi:ribonuclease D
MLHLSREELNRLPLFHYEGTVILVHTQQECAVAVEAIRGNAIIGVDTETRPSFFKGITYPPSLIQIATNSAVYLFHLSWVPFGPLVASLFEDAGIIKTGVAVYDDFRRLSKLYPFTPQSVLELGVLARERGVKHQGLRGLAGQYLQVRISKGERCSNWSNKELTLRQIRYAATDAWASLAVCERMHEQGTPQAASAGNPGNH